jgi:hypothetical protein
VTNTSLSRNGANVVGGDSGYHQQHLVYSDNVFAPNVSASTVELFFSNVAAADRVCHMVDISNPVVHGTVDKAFFMCQPAGSEDDTGNVLQLSVNAWSRSGTACLESDSFKCSSLNRLCSLSV